MSNETALHTRPSPRRVPSLTRPFGFRLDKWYLDCVTDDGAVFIGYAARLGIGPVRMTLGATLWSPPSGPASSQLSVALNRLPRLSDEGVEWVSRGLGLAGAWRGRPVAIRQTLLETPSHSVEWRCHLPACAVEVDFPAGRLGGSGYAEQLLLRGGPRDLPLEELHWGRFVAGVEYVVWIEWVGRRSLRRVVFNGSEQVATRADEEQVRWGTGTLHFQDTRSLRCGSVGSAAFGGSRVLRQLVPRSWATWTEEKWVSRGLLEKADGSVLEGWAVHERVRWS